MCTLRDGMLMHVNGLANHLFVLNDICWIVWGWFFKIRIISILGCMRLETLLWFIIHDLSCMILFCGYELDSSTRWQASMLIITGIYAGSHVPNEKSTIYMHRGIIIMKSAHFDYHLRVSEVRCWLKDWYWLHYWPWAIDACRDPWRWKRPWWIGKRERVIRVKMER